MRVVVKDSYEEKTVVDSAWEHVPLVGDYVDWVSGERKVLGQVLSRTWVTTPGSGRLECALLKVKPVALDERVR